MSDAAAGPKEPSAGRPPLELSAHQQAQLARYLEILQRWNATYNLTAIREPEAMQRQHLADCLAAVSPLLRWRSGGKLLDVGSGGGLPGAVIAIAAPAWQVCCVDKVGKKSAFIRQAAAELGLPNLQALHARVEQLPPQHADVITSRAFASLPDFVAWTRAHLAPGGAWMALKAQRPEVEMAALPSDVEVFHVERLEVPGLDAQRCLVWMKPRTANTKPN